MRLKFAPHIPKVNGRDFFDARTLLNPDSRKLFFQFIAELKESCMRAKPTATHEFLGRLAKEGKLVRWYTQNIDCLELELELICWNTLTSNTKKQSQSTVIPLHGTLSQVCCTLCKVTMEFTENLLEKFKIGDEIACPACTTATETRHALGRRKLRCGYLRPDIVLYNEHHAHGGTIADFITADINKQTNLILVMGTSLKIGGLKSMLKDFAKVLKSRTGAENTLIVLVNKTPCSRAEWQGIFDYELLGDCDSWVTFLEQEFQRIKTVPKAKIDRSQFIPSSPLRHESPKSTIATTKIIPSSPLQPKPKKKRSVVNTRVSEIVVSPVRPTSIATRIDEFFSPVKAISVISGLFNGKDKKEEPIDMEPPKRPTRAKRGSGLAI